MGAGTKREGTVMRRHCEVGTCQILPEKGRREMDGIECAEVGRHRLGRSIEDDRIDLYELQGCDQREDGGSARCHVGVGKPCAETKPIQGPKALGDDELACYALVDTPPLRQRVRLTKRDP